METWEFGAARLPRFHPEWQLRDSIVIRQIEGQNNGLNGAKVGEKVRKRTGRGWRLRNFHPNKRTYVLLEFPVFLPMLREYA
jgi:hypothetical protein